MTVGPVSPRKLASSPAKAIKRPPLVSEGEAGSSRPVAVVTRDEPVKRKQAGGDERLVLKIPRAARTSEVTAPGSLSHDREGLVGALAVSQEEASWLRQQLEARERELESYRERAQEWEEQALALSERWEIADTRVDRLQAQVVEVHEEMVGLCHALSVANEQGSREELGLRIAQLERRVEHEYLSLPQLFDLADSL